MPKTIKHKARKKRHQHVPSGRRKNRVHGKRYERAFPGSYLQCATPGAGMRRNDKPASIEVSLEPRDGIAIDMLVHKPGYCLLSNEADVLKCLQDVLPIAQQLPGYKDHNKWNKDTPLSHVLQHVLNQAHVSIYHKLQAGFKIAIEHGRYVFQIKKAAYLEEGENFLVLPVSYLPELEKKDKALFDLVFYFLVMFTKKVGVNLWEEIVPGGYVFEDMSYQSKELEDIAGTKLYGKGGLALKWYERLIKSGFSWKIWKAAFDVYKPQDQMGIDFKEWLQSGHDLLENEITIRDVMFIPEELQEQLEMEDPDMDLPILPHQWCRILWTDHGQDAGFKGWSSAIQYDSNNQGALPLFTDYTIHSVADITKKKNEIIGSAKIFMDVFRKARMLHDKYRKKEFLVDIIK